MSFCVQIKQHPPERIPLPWVLILILSANAIDAKAGQRIAIVGPTGCGKTTVINLLMRFYDVCGGTITIDGTDVMGITRKSLRKNFG